MKKARKAKQIDEKKYQWRLTERLVDDSCFQQYAGFYGAFLELIESVTKDNVKEFYVYKIVHLFARLKAKAISDGCFYSLYDGNDDLLIKDVLSFYNYLEDFLNGAYKKCIIETLSSMSDSCIKRGITKGISLVDPNLDMDVVNDLMSDYLPYFRYLMKCKNPEAEEDKNLKAINQLVEQGMTRVAAMNIVKMAKEGKDVDSAIVEALSGNEFDNEPMIEEIDIDEFLRECGVAE